MAGRRWVAVLRVRASHSACTETWQNRADHAGRANNAYKKKKSTDFFRRYLQQPSNREAGQQHRMDTAVKKSMHSCMGQSTSWNQGGWGGGVDNISHTQNLVDSCVGRSSYAWVARSNRPSIHLCLHSILLYNRLVASSRAIQLFLPVPLQATLTNQTLPTVAAAVVVDRPHAPRTFNPPQICTGYRKPSSLRRPLPSLHKSARNFPHNKRFFPPRTNRSIYKKKNRTFVIRKTKHIKRPRPSRKVVGVGGVLLGPPSTKQNRLRTSVGVEPTRSISLKCPSRY